jgi:hypothetical protein
MKKALFFLILAVMLLSGRGFAQSSCATPTGLTASLHSPDWYNVLLNWNAITDSTQANIMWSTTTFSTRIGGGDGVALDFTGTIRFTPTDLANYAGRYLTSVSFVPGENQTICSYYLMVWQGGSVTNDTIFNPGTLIVNQPITSALTISSMNTVLLDNPFLIDVTQELWIGIRCDASTGYPLGASNNTAVFNYGDLIAVNGNDTVWETLSGGDPTASLAAYNWLIIGHLQTADNILSGYNLYRNDVLLTSVGATSYLDSVPNGDYTYNLTAEYANGCESAPLSISVTMNDNPCMNCLDTVTVGTGTNTVYTLPLNTFYNYSYTQQIFTAAELGTINGAINCISFQYIYNTAQDKNIVVYMGNTNKSSFSNGTDWISPNQMFQVFSGTVNFTNAGPDGWVNIPFDVPFEYDGTSNIVVAVLNNTGTYVTSSNPTFSTHSASSKSLYLQNDSSPYSVNNPGSGTVGSDRNNMRFLIGDPVVCPMPTYLTASNITSNSVNINWHSNENHNGYELVLVPAGSTLNNETVEQLSDTFFAATNLLPNTNYTIYLRANCSSESSFWNMGTFKTLCQPTDQLPYVMDMDGFGTGSSVIPDCAERGLGGTYSSYPYLSTSYHHSGNASLYFYSYTPNNTMIRFQGLDLTNNTESLLMTFWEYKTSAGYGRITAGYMTDPQDFSTFVPVKNIYPSDLNTSVWTEFTFALPASVNGQVIYPTLYCPFAPGSTSNYVYIDDISIYVGQTDCMPPHNLTISNVGGTSAMVSWDADETAAGTETYHVEYAEQGTGIWQSVTTTGTFALLSGLTPQTYYDIMLYMDCDAGVYSDTLTETLLTNCLAGGELAIGNGTSTSSYFPEYSCYNYSYTQQLFLASEMNGASTLYSVAFEATSLESPSRHLSIYLMHTSQSNPSSYLPTDSAVMVYNGTTNLVVGWNTFNFTTPFQYNGTDNLVLIMVDSTGSYSCSNSWRVHTATVSSIYSYTDSAPYSVNPAPSGGNSSSYRSNVIFGAPCDSSATCVAPNVVVTNYTDEEITLTWAPGDQENSWELEYKTSDTTDWTSAGTVNTTTYTFTGLNPDTHYDFRVRAICSSSEFSNWAMTSAFTVCAYATVPFTENFESSNGTGAGSMANCWIGNTNNSTQYPYISTSQHASGTKSLYFYGTSMYYSYAAAPRFDDNVVMDSLQVNFKLYSSSTGYSIEMGIMSDPTNYNSFITLGTFTPVYSGVWEDFEVYTSAYAGSGHYLAFRIPAWGTSYMYLDDLSVDYMTPCVHPTNIAVQNITPDEATITWIPGDEESEWEYVYGLTGTVDLENASPVSVYTNSVTLSGLTDHTTYDIYVRSVCPGEGESHWITLTFTTECLPMTTLPYTQNFDSMTTSTSNATTGLNNLSDCWNAYNTGTSYTTYPYVYYSSSYAASGSYSLRFYTYTSSDYADQYAILPSLDTDVYPLNTLQLTFDARRYSTSYPFCLILGVMTGTDINTFQPIDTLLINSGSTYEPVVMFLSNYTGAGNRLALMAPKNIGNFVPSAYYNEGHIDNLVLQLAPTCPQPTHLTVDNVTNDAVTLSWQENGTATNWVIEYGPAGFTPGNGTLVPASTNPFTVSNLASATEYDFYVKSDCGAGEESPLCGPASATPGSYNIPTNGTFTITTCSLVIYDDGGASQNYSNGCDVTLILQPETAGNLISVQGTSSTESSWDYLRIYDGVGTSGTMLGEYTGSGLTVPPLTSTTGPLTISFYSDGSVNSYDGFMLTVSCASNTCPVPTNLTVSNIGTNSADITWTPGGTETAWVLEYKEATATTWTEIPVTTPSYQFTTLNTLTAYALRVKADCGAGDESMYVSTTFNTNGCSVADQCTYTFNLVDSYGDGWNNGSLDVQQNGVTIANLTLTSGSAGTETVMLCDNMPTSLVWNTGSFDSEVSFTVYGPNDSLVYTSSTISAGTLTTFTSDCSGAGPGPVITDPTVATNAATGIAQTTATLNGTITNPDNVTITAKGFEWKATAGGTYAPVTVTGNNLTYNLTGLTANTGYTYKAFITFNGTTVYGNEVTFTTLPDDVQPCDVPTGLHTTTVENEAIAIAWDANPDVTSWNIQYRPVGGTLASATSTTNSYNITGLTGLTTYEIQVQADCGNGNVSDWCTAITAQTTNVGIENHLLNSISLYPNPAKEYIDVRVDELNVTSMEVYDVYGKLINTVNVIDNPTRINVSSLASGMYFVRVTTEQGTATKSFVKK